MAKYVELVEHYIALGVADPDALAMRAKRALDRIDDLMDAMTIKFDRYGEEHEVPDNSTRLQAAKAALEANAIVAGYNSRSSGSSGEGGPREVRIFIDGTERKALAGPRNVTPMGGGDV